MKLFVFDVDGTLVNLSAPSKEVIEAVNERLAKGDAIAIASGRPYSGIKLFLDYFQDGLKFSLGANGAMVQKEDGEILKIYGLTQKDFTSFYSRHLDQVQKGLHIYAYTQWGIAFYERSSSVEWEIKWNEMKFLDLSKDKFSPSDEILKFMISAKPEYIEEFPLAPEDKAYRILRSDPHYLEFVRIDADKSTATEFVRQYLGIKKEDVYTFGDQGNDVEMLRSFQGVAMGNGTDECKKAAKFITKSVDEDGVAYALRNFVSD